MSVPKVVMAAAEICRFTDDNPCLRGKNVACHVKSMLASN
jgi:hypothetical protein